MEFPVAPVSSKFITAASAIAIGGMAIDGAMADMLSGTGRITAPIGGSTRTGIRALGVITATGAALIVVAGGEAARPDDRTGREPHSFIGSSGSWKQNQ
jgi:hypothetical protein